MSKSPPNMREGLLGDLHEERPPGLEERPSLLWGLSSGVHSGLLSLRDESWDAGYWRTLSAELLDESEHQTSPALAAELRCEAGRILIQRLGMPQEGRALIESSGASVAKLLLEGLPDDENSITNQLDLLKREADDAQRPVSTRVAALIELGLQSLYVLENPTRALAAFDAALDLEPTHPVAGVLSADLSLLFGTETQAASRARRRRDAANSVKVTAATSLDLAEATDDPERRVVHLKAAHAAEPTEETSLRRLIRAVTSTDDTEALAQLYLKLATLTEDPISTGTALHLAFLSALKSGGPLSPIVDKIIEAFVDDPVHAMAPMSEVAMHLERELATGGEGSALEVDRILQHAVDTMDDPREIAVLLKHAWSHRGTRGVVEGETTPAALDALEEDLRFCMLHLPEDNWPREELERLYKTRGDVPKLVALLEEWSRLQTNGKSRAVVLLRLGGVHEHMSNDLSRASEVYAHAAAEDRDNTTCLRALGRSYEALRRWQSAAESYLAQARESDDSHERLVTLRRVAELAQRELSDPDIAITALREVSRDAPEDLLSLYQLVALSRLHRRTPVLRESLERLVERVSDSATKATMLVELGEVLERGLNRRTDAKDAYARALKQAPGYTPALQALARIYRETGDFESLLALYDPVVDPVTDPAVLALKAARVCQEEFGDAGRAIMFARQAYETNPDLRPAVFILDHILRLENRLPEVYDLLRAQPEATTPALDAHRHYELGLVVEAIARDAASTGGRVSGKNAALQHYRMALQRQPAHVLAWERARRILVEASDLPNLADHLEQRIGVTEGVEQACLYVARARVLSGQPDSVSEARRCYEQALQSLPDDPIISREYAALLRLVADRNSLPSVYLSSADAVTEKSMSASMLIEAAEILLGSEQVEDRTLATDAVVRALVRDPGNPFAVRHLERLLLTPEQIQDLSQAVSVRAVRAQTDLERGIFYLESAAFLERAGDVKQARRAYRASLTAIPKNLVAELGLARTSERREGPPPVRRPVNAQAMRASIHALLGQARQRVAAALEEENPASVEAALKLLRQIFNRDASHRDGFRLLERMINGIQEPTPAVELLREFFWTMTDGDLRYELGLLLAEFARDPEERVRALRAATDAKGDSKEALERLVQAYRDAGDDAAAATVTESLLKLFSPDDTTAFELRLGLARHLAAEEGTRERALAHAEALVAAAPGNPRARTFIAEVLEAAGRPLDAEAHLRTLVDSQRDPADLRNLHIRRARLLARSAAHTKAAILATRQAFEVDPSDREAAQILIKLHERLDDMSGLQPFFAPARAAMMRKFAIGDVSSRDLQILTHMAKATSRPLGYTIQGVLHAIDRNFSAPPEAHFRPASAQGIDRIRNSDLLPQLLHRGELLPLTRLLAALEPVMQRLHDVFPKLSADASAPLPFNVKPTVLTPLLQQWCPAVGLAIPKVSSCNASNLVAILPTKPPTLQVGENLWMQGNEHDWRGLTAVALARHALGAGQVRALDQIEFDLMLAATFECVSVFNAITADPDPGRLSELTARLNRSLPRKARKVIEQCCHQLSNENFTPSVTVTRTTVGDLRLAYLLSGDVAGVLSAACLLDGVSGPDLKQRLQKSKTGQQLLIDLVSDPITQCRELMLAER